jgi:hypothetical protein
MSELPTYSFLPWLRTGAANAIQSADRDPAVLLRARMEVSLEVTANKTDNTPLNQTITQDLDLYGPADIIGIDTRAIVKTDPRDWITNFEPNYLPYIDFYDEDFPWRYTPARVEGQRLRPWIALVVLKTEEFEERSKGNDQPLPSIALKPGTNAGSAFPDPEKLWAWAHVHVNRDLASGDDASNATVVGNLGQALGADPDIGYSRIISPRKLEEKAAYHAFLIPCFEGGRLAGLGAAIPPDTVATASAWDNGQTEFPYYYRWYFRTGTKGDFEYLVKLLKPQPADTRVGVRDMDLLHPGSNLPPLTDPASLGGVLKLGGALRVPFATLPEADQQEILRYDQWDEDPYPHPFEQRLADLVNLADDYTTQSALQANTAAQIESETGMHDPDPVITMPLYARWHALVNRLLTDRDGAAVPHNTNWVHELNLDPRFRVPAGLGTKVVQDNQESYMDAAWQQVGDVLDANRRIRWAELAKAASFFYFKKHFTTLPLTPFLSVTAPLQKRVLSQGLTLHYTLEESRVPTVVTSAVFRRVTSPRGVMARRITRAFPTAAASLKQANWAESLNQGVLVLAPAKASPQKGLLLEDAAASVTPGGLTGQIGSLIAKYPWLKTVLLGLVLLFIVLAFLTGVYGLLLISAGALALYRWSLNTQKAFQPALNFDEARQQPQWVDQMPTRPDFKLSVPADHFNPGTGTSDSAESVKFKAALKDAFRQVSIDYAPPARKSLALPQIRTGVLDQIHPDTAVVLRVGAVLHIPARIKEAQATEDFVPVMAYPEFDIPMYLPLSTPDSELFLPHINLIPENSISLLETNQKFIEAYMAGINHEMSRELLWREYPTDQRGSYFRQFWDVSSFYPGNPPPEDIREKLRDIPPLHKWSLSSDLGDHNQRTGGSDKALLVLVIRGELLKRYPTAVIYAQKAQWDTTDGVNDPSKERQLVPLSEAESDDPPASKVKTPLFEAKVDPDIYFLGFDLTAPEVKGGTAGTDDPGWFFVIKERPGEPRFGLDEPEDNTVPRLINWNNLCWLHIATAAGSCIALDQTLSFTPYNAGVDQENKPNPSDSQAKWSPDTDAAQLAYILYQVPVMVAVHGSRMLP